MAESSQSSEDELVTIDITPPLQIARNDLGEGEVKHGENFALTVTMSASKDQRVDPDFVTTPYSTDEAIKNGAAPVPLSSDRTLDIQRVIDVMDHFLTCEAAWHGGADLEQTIFSCIYLRNPPSRLSSHALLHSFFRVARMTCNAVSSVLLIASVENDEEFHIGESLQMLQEVEEKISRQLKACKAPLSKKRLFEGVEPLQTNPDLEEEFCKAVLCRLRFRKHFYHMLTSLRRTQVKGFDLAKKHIASCSSELESMLKSEEFLTSCAVSMDSMEHKTTASGSQPLGFDYLSRPHTIELRSWKEGVHYFQKILHDLKIICSNSLSPVLEDAVHFVVDLHTIRPCMFARAYIQLMLVQDGRLYGCEPIFVIICKAALLPKQANNHDIQKLRTVAELGKLLIKLLRALCKDVVSQRCELVDIIWDWRRILPQLGSDFRRVCDPARFSSDQHKFNVQMCKHILVWVEEQKLRTALRYLLLGFDMKTYSPSDYCMTYWYIYMILIELTDKIMLKTSLRNESIKRKARTTRKGSVNDLDEEPEVPPEVLLLKCYTRVAEGLIAILGVLRTKHKLFVCPSSYTEEQRFSLNFSALKEGVSYWPEVSYKVFKQCTSLSSFSDKSLGEHDSFERAHRIVKQLRGKYGNDAVRLAEVERLNTVAMRNRVTFNFLRLLKTLDGSITVSFEFDQHPHFAVAMMNGLDQLPSKSLQLLNINAS